jgi:phenylpropionate dioxygenase-like ring-hydroxylating dioxygenase large terminal subunit
MTALETTNDATLARSAGCTYQELLDSDTRAVPAVLRMESPMEPGPSFVAVDRYTSPEFHRLEVERLWRRVWQMACREEDIPNVGDHLTYDVAGISILVVRNAPDRISAFHNVCLHRGRLLKTAPGCDTELRCAFHGFAWNMDGTMKHVPCKWDFPQVSDDWSLPQVRVDTWGGFVFVNPDPDAAPLTDHLGNLTEHFAAWPLEERFKQAHVAKVLRCNWKLAQEAFMEAYHVVATHPQLLPGIGDANSQYDVFGNFSRAITPNGTPSPHLRWEPSQQDMLDAMLDRNLDDPLMVSIPDGSTAREVAGNLRRTAMVHMVGEERAAKLSDAEMCDSFYYTVFPNFHPWGSYNRIVYRFRPYGNRHDMSIMECMFLSPFVGERPPSAPIHILGPDDDWTDAPELGLLARVFNQDVFNLPEVQAGLETGAIDTVTFANYQETKLRHFHELLEQWVGRPVPEA